MRRCNYFPILVANEKGKILGMIKLENVNKYFNRRRKNQIHIINNTSLELPNTGLVAILGNSGSGKTTLLNAIGGLDRVNKRKNIYKWKKDYKRNRR